jgi:hypothetical protein
MRRFFAAVSVLLFTALSTHAQDSYPSAEVFGGFSYLNADFPHREGLYGWGVSFSGNLTKNFGLVAEASGNYGHVPVPPIQFGPIIILPGFNAETSFHTFLFGPRLSVRKDRWTAFGHVLIGGARKSSITGTTALVGQIGASLDPRLIGDTGFAMTAGGGLDIKSSKRVWVRVFQIDYLPVRLSDEWTHNIRAQAGIVFRFGGD